MAKTNVSRVVEDIYAIEHAFTNCYLVVDQTAVTVIDACFPSTWSAVQECLTSIGRRVSDVAGLLLTHGHFDHVGFARHLQTDLDIPVWIHQDDHWLAQHPYRYRPERDRLLYPLGHPRSLPVLTRMVAAGALRVRGVQATVTFESGRLDLPGSPIVVPTPGHTSGHCAFYLPDRDVVFTGDALVTLDPYTGRSGPRMVAPAATADVERNRRSLCQLGEVAAGVVLPGHGRPWRHGSAAAVSAALGPGRG
ncbi:MAG: MBL fold metallo-hydrolase [Microlunatus sp.]|nr:MBL fold metallo-hydrolase [Microlunatus sp.]MDN5803332.1 MBL fold metallo-hydrolase [Microlunatus sp.]